MKIDNLYLVSVSDLRCYVFIILHSYIYIEREYWYIDQKWEMRRRKRREKNSRYKYIPSAYVP